MREFQLIALTPPCIPDPSIAIAANRAGGIGVIDLEYVTEVEIALDAVAKLVQHARGRGCGVRLCGRNHRFIESVISNLPNEVNVVIMSHSEPDLLYQQVQLLKSRNIVVLLEVTLLEHAILGVEKRVDGLIAKGNEAGGWVSEDTTFILLQKLLNKVSLPVWVQGGIGLHTAAACFAAGAAGAVLDVQLSLTRESPLPEEVKTVIARMDGSETICLGGEINEVCRVYARPGGHTIISELRQLAEPISQDKRSREEIVTDWYQTIQGRVGWGTSGQKVWFIGQDAAFAASLAQRFHTVGGILEGIREAITSHVQAAKVFRPLDENAPLARSHNTRYPIVQGPMTRVSDIPAFALSIAEGGALPFLALAMLHAPEIKKMLEETQRLLAGRPWGVGILGFLSSELLREQLDVIQTYKPPFVLIAGGLPDQAHFFEQMGLNTYMHVSSTELLRVFVENGIRRFVFEGRECGGHIGPRSSFVLWNSMIDALLDLLKGNEPTDFHVLFAGGIHDSLSSSMIATMAAPLSERGVKIGVLLGTSYLFTKEALTTGAIVKGFQDEAITCMKTVILESGPGYAIRCSDTPFTTVFMQEKLRLISEGRSSEEIRDALEDFSLGRLRMASKGVARNPMHELEPGASKYILFNEEEQHSQGMYMIGQLAMLRDQVCTVEDLHQEISVKGAKRLECLTEPELSEVSSVHKEHPSDIAIIGMACVFPKSGNLQTYWENILNKVDAITEVPKDRWDWRVYFDSDPKTRDKVYSKWGGFIDPVLFDPIQYGMPPNTLTSIEPLQLLTLEAVRMAIEDAGYSDRPFSRERSSVILGASGGAAELGQQYSLRSSLPMVLKNIPPDILSNLPEWTEDSFAGILLNVAAGRVANRFDLGGVNFTVDAACASSLAAVYLAVKELENGTSDMVFVGGVDTLQNPFAYLCFSKTHALSPSGRCRTFDESADGIVISEGIAVIVLKRLIDAERNGDRIYAIIKSVGGSSDGRDKGLTAPRPEGQIRALNRAYAKADFSPATVGLIEAHGTGTVIGDRTEVETLKKVFESSGAIQQTCAIGSVKSMIGHTKSTAGLAGIIKTALALHHKIVPPTMGVEKPNSILKGSPFYVNTETRPWIHGTDKHLRRAGVSAFGFGGTNFHAVLEEYGGNYLESVSDAPFQRLPSELLIFEGNFRKEILEAIESLDKTLQDGAKPELRDLAYTLWKNSRWDSPKLRLAVVPTSLDDLRQKLKWTRDVLIKTEQAKIQDPRGIYYTEEPIAQTGKIALLFPGQGSQYPDMLCNLTVLFSEVRERFKQADRVLSNRFPQPLSNYIFPPPRFDKEEEKTSQRMLTQTNIAQPALGAADMGLFQLLQSFGLKPDMVAGHSYGEYVALCAAGVFTEDTLYALSEARGRFIMEMSGQDLGTMVAVEAGREAVAEVIQSSGEVWIANLNSPRQTIISGTQSGIDEIVRSFTARGIQSRPLKVSCAFHSPLIAPARNRLAEFLSTLEVNTPKLEVFSNSMALAYPKEPKAVTEILSDHLVRPVEFEKEVNEMYKSGARIFVEVGPRNILTGLTHQILEGRQYLAVATDIPGRAGLLQLQHVLGQLISEGVPLHLQRLYQGRRVRQLNLKTLVEQSKEKAPSSAACLVDGFRIKPIQGTVGTKESKISVESSVKDKVPVYEEGDAQIGNTKKSAVLSNEPPMKKDNILKRVDTFQPLVSALPDADGDTTQVMLQFQQIMNKFLETQQKVMQAYLQGSTESGISAFNTPISEGLPDISSIQALTPESPVLAKTKEGALEPLHVTGSTMMETSMPSKIPSNKGSMPLIDREQLTVQLLDIVSERTGYPKEMLDLDLNIEADLGIDSIKRIEILGTLQRTYLPLGEKQVVMEELTKIKSMRGIIDWIANSFHPLEVQEIKINNIEQRPTEVYSDKKTKLFIDREQLTVQLLDIVSERTGYPKEMLDLDLNIEADLGIDSIKRIEILGTLQRTYLPLGEKQVVMEELTKIKSMRGIIDWIANSFHPPEVQEVKKNGNHNENAPRFLIDAVDVAVSKINHNLRLDSLFVITEDELGVGRVLAEQLQRAGGRIVYARMGEKAAEVEADLYIADLTSSDSVATLVELIHQKHGPIGGLIHLLPLRTGLPYRELDMEKWRKRLGQEVKSLFYLIKAVSPDLRKAAKLGGSWIIAATTMGNIYETSKEEVLSFFPGQGGIAGLIKTTALELPGVICKVVDLDLEESVTLIAGYLHQEMICTDRMIETVYRDSCRRILQTKSFSINGNSRANLIIDSDWVVLITGGARGITAEIACEMAMCYKPTLILVGRSPLPDIKEGVETAGLTSPQELKAAIMNQMQRTGQTVTPARVEAAYTRLLHDREIQRNLSIIEQAGAKVQYYQVDVRDEEAFASLIDEIYHFYGRLDGVIHGAGVIEDKLLEDKNPDSFDRVFDTKTDSAFILSRKLRVDSLKFLIFFSSVAGCFGNRGQIDYSAANEVLNKLAIYLDRRWPGRVAAINWGPWANRGMVSAEVRRQFAEQGVQLIATDTGRRMFVDEIRFGQKGEAVVVIGNGPWGGVQTFPFIGNIIPKPGIGDSAQITLTLDPVYHRYLTDHQLDGKPVLPIAVAVEMMAEAVQRSWPDCTVVGFDSLQVFRRIVLDNGIREISIIMTKLQANPLNGGHEINIEIFESEQTDYPCYRATVQIGDEYPKPPVSELPKFPEFRSFPMTVAEAYRNWLFHGPCFQRITVIEGINQEAICADILPSCPGDLLHPMATGHWMIDPVVLDVSFQLGILWGRAHYDVTSIPLRFSSFRLFSPFPISPIRCYVYAKSSSEGQIISTDNYFFDTSGRLLALLKGVEFSCSKQLNRLTGNVSLFRQDIP